jgi:hypothetical protein
MCVFALAPLLARLSLGNSLLFNRSFPLCSAASTR